MPDAVSPYYPYFKVQDGYYDLSESIDIPKKICDYLLDAPSAGYTPADDNSYPRARLWKYLYYDGENPLGETLPTIQQKTSVLFDPERPEDPPTDKGYRLIPQKYAKQSQDIAQTRIHVYMGRTVPGNEEFNISLGISFNIWTHYTYEFNAKPDAYSRVFAIEQALIEALHGVNMAGIGTFFFSKLKHPDCGSNAVSDDNANVGRELTVALELAAPADRNMPETYNMPTDGINSNVHIF